MDANWLESEKPRSRSDRRKQTKEGEEEEEKMAMCLLSISRRVLMALDWTLSFYVSLNISQTV